MNDQPSAIQLAKDTLLRALDQLEEAERGIEAEPERVELCVIYSVGRAVPEDEGAWHEVSGFATTAAPLWSHAALLRRAAEAFESDTEIVETDDDDEPEESN